MSRPIGEITYELDQLAATSEWTDEARAQYATLTAERVAELRRLSQQPLFDASKDV